MSGMHKFVTGNRNGRPESPQNGQPTVNPRRQAVAAKLKIPVKSRAAQPPTGPGLDEHGESVAQHEAAPVQQQNLQRRPPGEGRKRDPYDTDAESLDTTVNHSVVQVESSPQLDRQSHPGHAVYETSGDEEDLDEGSDDEAEEEERYQFTEEQKQYLEQKGATDLGYHEQMGYLSRGPPYLFPAVDGDSYPTTTDGNPTEWDGQQERSFEDLGSPSPSPQRLTGQVFSAPTYDQQPLQRSQVAGMPHAIPVVQQNTKIFRQGAQIRGQQRVEVTAHARSQPGQQHATLEPQTSQPPTYSQANQELGYLEPPSTRSRPYAALSDAQSGIPHRSSRLPPVPRPAQNPIQRTAELATTSTGASETRPEAVSIIQQPLDTASVEPASIEEHQDVEHQEHQGDYDSNVLANMKYDELRVESFDKNPREQGHTLPENMRGRPLPERLQFAQQELDLANQAKFFSALPTTEWEDAGDWFLGRFTAIITSTREARQKKRKQAQLFEETIEGRHQQVAKKQRLVEGAMAKMQAQGEGLVPKTPRASKSPRPRRG